MGDKYLKLSSIFIDEFNSSGSCTPLDRCERLSIQFFAKWLDKKINSVLLNPGDTLPPEPKKGEPLYR